VEGFTVYGDAGSVRRAPFESVDLEEEGFFLLRLGRAVRTMMVGERGG